MSDCPVRWPKFRTVPKRPKPTGTLETGSEEPKAPTNLKSQVRICFSETLERRQVTSDYLFARILFPGTQQVPLVEMVGYTFPDFSFSRPANRENEKMAKQENHVYATIEAVEEGIRES